jgi:hypothetical protein
LAGKISPELERRIARLPPASKVSALVVLHRGNGTDGTKRRERLSSSGRAARAAAVHEVAELALPEIDAILARHHGKRLTAHVGPLGYVPIEATPAGLKALASSDLVVAVLEDQPISLVSSRR